MNAEDDPTAHEYALRFRDGSVHRMVRGHRRGDVAVRINDEFYAVESVEPVYRSGVRAGEICIDHVVWGATICVTQDPVLAELVADSLAIEMDGAASELECMVRSEPMDAWIVAVQRLPPSERPTYRQWKREHSGRPPCTTQPKS